VARFPIIEYPVAGGIDTKTDPKLVRPPKCLDIVNGMFTKHGSVVARFGYDALVPRDLDELSVDGLRSVDKRAQELVGFSDGAVYGRVLDRWGHRGNFTGGQLTTEPVADRPADQTEPMYAQLGDLRAHAWLEGTALYFYMEDSNRTQVVAPTEVNANASQPVLLATSTNFLLVFIDTYYSDIVVATCGQTIQSRRLMLGDLHGDELFTAAWDPDGDSDAATPVPWMVVCYRSTTGHRFLFYRSTGLAHPTKTPETQATAATSYITAHVHEGAGILFFYGALANTKSEWIPSDDGAKLSGPTLSATSTGGTAVSNNTGASDPANDISLLLQWGDDIREVRVSGDTSNTTPTYTGVFAYDVTLHGGATRRSALSATLNRDWVVPVQRSSTLQPTVVLLDPDATAVARVAPELTSVTARNQWQPGYLNGDQMQFVVNDKKIFTVEADQFSQYSQSGCRLVTLDLAAKTTTQEYRDSLYIAGSALFQYDGSTVVEQGFWFYPEVDLTQGTLGSAVSGQPYSRAMATGANTYLYFVCYEWYDATGKRWQSRAFSFTLTTADDPGTTNVVFDIPALQFSSKTGVEIAVYRTAASDSDGLAYRVSAVGELSAQNSSNTDVTFTDDTADASVKAGENFYASIGITDKTAPGAVSLITAHDDRLFAVNGEDSTQLVYTDRPEGFEGPAFSLPFVLQTPREGGDVTALASMDQFLLIFKEDRVYALRGEGPGNTLLGQDYTVPTLVSTDVGCSNPDSIVRLPNGIAFQSDKGIYLMGRNLQVVYIGADVEAYNDVTITGADLVPDENSVVFLTAGDRTLHFNYEHNAWSTFDGHAGLDSVVIDDDYYYLRTDGENVFKRAAHYQDDGAGVALTMELAWMVPSGVQRYWRCYLAQLLGNYSSEHTLEVDVAINYREYYEYTWAWDPSDGLALDTWGGNATLGGGEAWGISDLEKPDSVYMVSHSPRTQLVTAIKFRIRTVLPGTPGAGFELTAVALEYKSYGGAFRTPSGKHG